MDCIDLVRYLVGRGWSWWGGEHLGHGIHFFVSPIAVQDQDTPPAKWTVELSGACDYNKVTEQVSLGIIGNNGDVDAYLEIWGNGAKVATSFKIGMPIGAGSNRQGSAYANGVSVNPQIREGQVWSIRLYVESCDGRKKVAEKTFTPISKDKWDNTVYPLVK